MLAEITSKFYSLIIGGLFMLVIYHFLVFLQNKKQIYLYYSGYLFFISLYMFAPNFSDVIGRAILDFNGAFLCLSFAFYFQLTKTILSTKSDHKVLNNILTYGIYILLIASGIFPVIAKKIGYVAFIKSYDAFAVFLTIYCCVIYGYLIKIKTIYARYILTASLLYFSCSMIVLFIGIFIGSNAFLEQYGFNAIIISYIGFTLEALIFALLIGYRAKEIEIEKITSQAKYTLEKERVATLLKEQEINAINAMIAGQEKERQKLASDLHDSVGATLSAIKLQFEHITNVLKPKKSTQELFFKTKQLLEEAYTEVRSMAHIKNSGVIAKNGLLPAVKKLAKNVSTKGKLEVSVQDYGLENKLDGNLEITIFRIIQELTTNIIKHSKAKEASINLTQHEDILSIIIEDNGQGFDFSKQLHKEGMGLNSIERRIEHLEGTLEVDSTPGKGTTILIDIPL